MIVDPRRIELSPQQQDELAALAARCGKPWDEVLQEALTRYDRESAPATSVESFLSIATRLGLIGCLSGGSPDLSTNPVHFQGFGE